MPWLTVIYFIVFFWFAAYFQHSLEIGLECDETKRPTFAKRFLSEGTPCIDDLIYLDFFLQAALKSPFTRKLFISLLFVFSEAFCLLLPLGGFLSSQVDQSLLD